MRFSGPLALLSGFVAVAVAMPATYENQLMERGQKSGCEASCYRGTNLCINNGCRRSCDPNIPAPCANAGPGGSICAGVFDMDGKPLGSHCVEGTLACCGQRRTDNFKLLGADAVCNGIPCTSGR